MRLLHTMLRVGDMDKSIAFYTEVLGMTLLRRKDYPEGQFTLAFVGSVVSETVASNYGLGNMMSSAQSQFNVPLVFAGLMMLAVEGIAMYALMAWIERRMTGWLEQWPWPERLPQRVRIQGDAEGPVVWPLMSVVIRTGQQVGALAR